MSKIREKKLNSIKSEIEEIKKFIISNNNSNYSEKNKTDYSNNNDDEDTLILTQIIKDEKNFNNNNELSETKKDFLELKKAIEINKNLIKEILLKIK